MDGFKFELGQKVHDSVTGLEGEITGRAQHVHTPPQYLIEAVDDTGRPIAEWVLEPRITEE